MKIELDDIDYEIIDILQKDGSKTLSEIASTLKVGIATVYRRLRKLRMEGIIEGYMVVINPKKLGMKVMAILEIKTELNQEEKAIEILKKIDEITEIYKISGSYGIIVKIKTYSIQALNLIVNQIKNIRGIASLNTNMVLETVKETFIYPIKKGESI